MAMLSVNLNKVALLRNSRGEGNPSILRAAEIAIGSGCRGLTLHPREDRRHATFEDIVEIARMPEVAEGRVELNVEGDLRDDLIALVAAIAPAQFTVVPVEPGELTSHRGWASHDDQELLASVAERMAPMTRVILFVDPAEPASLELAATAGVAGVELYTRAFAIACSRGGGEELQAILSQMQAYTNRARELGLRVNAGHDLDLHNLPTLIAAIRPDEVSIGHALTSDALFTGWGQVVSEYVVACRPRN